MTVEITNRQNSVLLTYIADNGGSATAVVAGASTSEVREMATDIVATHELDKKAQRNGQ